MAVVCPIMSSGTQGVSCVEAKCALWDSLYSKCCHAAGAERMVAALNSLEMLIAEIKARM